MADFPEEWKLGTQVETALTAFGITKERVSAFLGAPCNCSCKG